MEGVCPLRRAGNFFMGGGKGISRRESGVGRGRALTMGASCKGTKMSQRSPFLCTITYPKETKHWPFKAPSFTGW